MIGPNGAGKTTLFRMITGQEEPDQGSIRLGETVQLGYVDQSRDSLNPKRTVWEEISDGNEIIDLGKKQVNSRAWVGAFNFKGRDQQKEVGTLSGGERNRVHLAKMVKNGGNLLLLDEPMAGMGHEDIGRTSDLIRRVSANRTVLMVEHNLNVVADLSDTITVLQRGEILAEGPYSEVSRNPQVMEAYMGTGHA